MVLDGFGDQLMSFQIRVDAIRAEKTGIVLLLQEDGRDVDDGHLFLDGDLKHLDIVALVPVGNILLIVSHPLEDIVTIEATGNVGKVACRVDRWKGKEHGFFSHVFHFFDNVLIGLFEILDSAEWKVFSLRIFRDLFPVKIAVISAELQDDIVAIGFADRIQIFLEDSLATGDGAAESSLVLDLDSEGTFTDFLERFIRNSIVIVFIDHTF